MKRTRKAKTASKPARPAAAGRLLQDSPAHVVAFAAHPDDIEFGCGGVIAGETQAGRTVHFVICSHGESATNGTPAQRLVEAGQAAALLGATVEFIQLDGDAHLERKPMHAIALAAVLRRVRPSIVLAPSLEGNQHPDHSKLGELVRDATRLARYGGVEELKDATPHATEQLFFYALSPDAEPRDRCPVLIDVSAPAVIRAWKAAMDAHRSQMRTRNYSEFQLTRARLHGLRAGLEYATPLWPNDPPVFSSLLPFERSARHF